MADNNDPLGGLSLINKAVSDSVPPEVRRMADRANKLQPQEASYDTTGDTTTAPAAAPEGSLTMPSLQEPQEKTEAPSLFSAPEEAPPQQAAAAPATAPAAASGETFDAPFYKGMSPKAARAAKATLAAADTQDSDPSLSNYAQKAAEKPKGAKGHNKEQWEKDNAELKREEQESKQDLSGVPRDVHKPQEAQDHQIDLLKQFAQKAPDTKQAPSSNGLYDFARHTGQGIQLAAGDMLDSLQMLSSPAQKAADAFGHNVLGLPSIPSDSFRSAEKEFEQGVPPEDLGDTTTQVSKGLTGALAYAALPGGAETAAGKYLESAAQGAVMNPASYAQEQLAEHKPVTAQGILGHAALGAGEGLVGQKALNTLGAAAGGVRNFFRNPEEKAEHALQQAVTKGLDQLATHGKIDPSLLKEWRTIQKEIDHHNKMVAFGKLLVKRTEQLEEEGLAKAFATLVNPAAENSIQAAQKAWLEAVEKALDTLSGVKDLWNVTQPEHIDAINTLREAGYMGIGAIETALEGRGIKLGPFLLEMKALVTKAPEPIITPTPLSRSAAALEGQHGHPPISQDKGPLQIGIRGEWGATETAPLPTEPPKQRATREAFEGQHGQPPVSKGEMTESVIDDYFANGGKGQPKFAETPPEPEDAIILPSEDGKPLLLPMKQAAKAKSGQPIITPTAEQKAKYDAEQKAMEEGEKAAREAHESKQAAFKLKAEKTEKAFEGQHGEPPVSTDIERADAILQKLKPDQSPEERKETIDELRKAGLGKPPSEAQPLGTPPVFRRPDRAEAHGHGMLDQSNITPNNLRGILPDDMVAKLDDAVNEIHQAKAALMHADDELWHAGKAVYKLAKGDAEKEKAINYDPQGKKKMTSQAAAKLAAQKADLKLAQDLSEQQELEAARDALQEAHDNALSDKKREELFAKITKIHDRMEELSDPRRGIPMGQKLYTIGNPEKFAEHNASKRQAPKTFEEAVSKWDEADDDYKAAVKKLKDTQDAHKPIFDQVQKAFQAAMENVRPGVEHETPAFESVVSHPFEPSVKTKVASQLRFEKAETKFNEKYQSEWDQIYGMAKADLKNFHLSETFSRLGRSTNWSSKRAHDWLTKRGLINPNLRRTAMAALLGAASFGAGQMAEAADESSMAPEQKKTFWGSTASVVVPVGTTLFAAAMYVGLKRHFGAAAAPKVFRNLRCYEHSVFRYAQDAARDAGQAMGFYHPHESLANTLEEFRGVVSAAQTFVRDYPAMLEAVANGRMDAQQHLTPEGLRAIELAIHTEAEAKQHARDFIAAWRPWYAEHVATSKDPGALDSINDGLNWLDKNFANSRFDAPDLHTRVSRAFRRGSMVAMFLGAPKNWVAANIFDLMANGPFTTGTKTFYTAWAGTLFDPLVKQAAKRVNIAGPLSRGAELHKPLSAEVNKGRAIYAAVALKYFADHSGTAAASGDPESMAALGIKSWQEFFDKATKGDLPYSVLLDYHTKASHAAAQWGNDVIGLNKTRIERNPDAALQILYTAQPVREGMALKTATQLMIKNFAEGEPEAGLTHFGTIANHYLVKWQAGGAKGALPVGLLYLGYNLPFTQQMTNQMVQWMNANSIIHQNFGDFGSTISGDPFIPEITGVAQNFFQNTLEAADDVQNVAGDLGSLSQLASEGRLGDILTGSGVDDEVMKGRAGFQRLTRAAGPLCAGISAGIAAGIPEFGAFANLMPQVGAGFRIASNVIPAIAHGSNHEYESSVPAGGLLSGAGHQFSILGRRLWNPEVRTNENGEPIESEEDAKWRTVRDAVIEALGIKSPTLANMVEAEQANSREKTPGQYEHKGIQ